MPQINWLNLSYFSCGLRKRHDGLHEGTGASGMPTPSRRYINQFIMEMRALAPTGMVLSAGFERLFKLASESSQVSRRLSDIRIFCFHQTRIETPPTPMLCRSRLTLVQEVTHRRMSKPSLATGTVNGDHTQDPHSTEHSNHVHCLSIESPLFNILSEGGSVPLEKRYAHCTCFSLTA